MAAIQATDVCLMVAVPMHDSSIDFLQVVITTYQTLNTDFFIPTDLDHDEEREWLIDNGSVLLTTFCVLNVKGRAFSITADSWRARSGSG